VSQDSVTLTVVVKSSDVDLDSSPSRDREHNRPTGCVSNNEGGILGAILRNFRHLESP
jgi:hypothetical protein